MGLGLRVYSIGFEFTGSTAIMESYMEKKKEHEMEIWHIWEVLWIKYLT